MTTPLLRRAPTQHVLTEREKGAISGLLSAMEPFFALRGTMPAQYIKAFLLEALEEGLGVGDYAERAGVSISVMSRHLKDIGSHNRKREEGFGLVTDRVNPLNERKKEVVLTPEGRALTHKIIRNWER